MKSVRVTVYSDYICPFCYIGKGLVGVLQEEFPLTVEWLPFEIHPETPAEGVLLAEAYPELDAEEFFGELDRRGRSLGVRFAPLTLLSNSRPALEAGEFARDHGRHEAFHGAVFRRYFSEGRDIGDLEIILEAAREVGLDENELTRALETKVYAKRLEAIASAAREQGARAIPRFVIEGGETIIGAQPLETFRAALRQALGDPEGKASDGLES